MRILVAVAHSHSQAISNQTTPYPSNAPVLPTAAATPFAVVLMLAGNSSDGIKKVVGDGPNPLKKKVDAYMQMVKGQKVVGSDALEIVTRKNAMAVRAKPCN